jgi:hypothetical protein
MGQPEKQRLEHLLGPTGFEVTCDECFEQLDAYVEVELAGGDANLNFPGLRTHLEGCPACREDHESLLALVKSDDEA